MWTNAALAALLVTLFAVTWAQSDGRYRPPTTSRTTDTSGRNRGAGDGRYRPSGDGRYRGGNDGKYVHQGVNYEHDDRRDAGYKGDASKYKPERNTGAGSGVSGGGGGGGSGGGAGGGGAIIASKASALFSKSGSTAAKASTRRPTVGTQAKAGANPNGWKIIHLHDKVHKDGYEYAYETENGILAEESGRIEKLNAADGLRSTGYYEYTGDDNVLYRVDYVADDNGFVPIGAHIPSPPPHVAKLLAFLAANPGKEKK